MEVHDKAAAAALDDLRARLLGPFFFFFSCMLRGGIILSPHLRDDVMTYTRGFIMLELASTIHSRL